MAKVTISAFRVHAAFLIFDWPIFDETGRRDLEIHKPRLRFNDW